MITYYLIRILTYPFGFLPFWALQITGKFLGSFLYLFLPKFRKRALSNLALAKDLNLSSREIRTTAKNSFKNLCITYLEYAKLARGKNLEKSIICKNPEVASKLYQQKKGIVFFCAHQANWETLFIDGTSKMKGIAIGKPLKNRTLYNWILKIREQNGGRIIEPQKALKESLKALRQGIFVGILGDQGMPTSDFSYPFLGTRAWTSTAPALLAIKTNSPIIYAETRREFGKYVITYSDPIFPNLENPLDKEVPRLMNKVLSLLEESIRKRPSEWLWQHNRYKQLTPHKIYREYRHDSILIILPRDPRAIKQSKALSLLLSKIYDGAFITLLSPTSTPTKILHCEHLHYSKDSEKLLDDYRFKIVYDFTGSSEVQTHYLSKAVVKVVNLKPFSNDIIDNAKQKLIKLICRPGTFTTKNS